MKTSRTIGTLAAPAVLGLACAFGLTSEAVISSAAATTLQESTEDVLYLKDGRELHGRIAEESDDSIVFELVLIESGIRTRMTILKDEIATIARDIAAAEEAAPERPRQVAQEQEAETHSTYGARRSDSVDESLPSFYIVPLKGQMGTDITPSIYKKMVDDIRANDPDYLVFVVDCRDYEDKIIYGDVENPEKGFAGPEMIDRYRELVNIFRDDLRDIKQCVWIHDSVGISSALAFAWNDVYMTPEARLGGVSDAARRGFDFENIGDEDVKGKMREAYMAFLRGFAEYSDVVPEVIDAMVRAEFMLSGSWKGREVQWFASADGQYVVDSSDQSTASFRAKTAEDLCLSKGTAEDLDDLALLLGFREYRLADGRGEEIFDSYVEDWRRKLDMVKSLWADYQQYRGWANGADALKYLGRCKQILKQIVAAIDQYEAVETRVAMELGLQRFALITEIEVIEEQIKAMRRGGRGGGGGGGRGGGGSGPSGGG